MNETSGHSTQPQSSRRTRSTESSAKQPQGLGAVAGEACQQTAAVLLQQDLRRRVGVKV